MRKIRLDLAILGAPVQGIGAAEDGLVVFLGILVLAVKAAEERVAAFTNAALEHKFGFLSGDSDEAKQIHLPVIILCAAQELELPVGPTADIENTVGTTATVQRNEPAVVLQSRLKCIFIPLGAHADFIKERAACMGIELETKFQCLL